MGDLAKELEKILKQKIQDSLKNEVAQVVKKTMQEHVESDVYDAYHIDEDTGELTQPFRYKRRGRSGGLADIDLMESDVNDLTLSVSNMAKGEDGYLAGLINYGDGYNGMHYEYDTNRDDTSWQYLRPRPFIDNTAEELNLTKEHEQVLRQALRKRGLNVD
jgi:hypothetical protein